MNLMALLKAGCIVTVNDRTRFKRQNNLIVVDRIYNNDWLTVQNFPLSKDGLEKCLEYINLPF